MLSFCFIVSLSHYISRETLECWRHFSFVCSRLLTLKIQAHAHAHTIAIVNAIRSTCFISKSALRFLTRSSTRWCASRFSIYFYRFYAIEQRPYGFAIAFILSIHCKTRTEESAIRLARESIVRWPNEYTQTMYVNTRVHLLVRLFAYSYPHTTDANWLNSTKQNTAFISMSVGKNHCLNIFSNSVLFSFLCFPFGRIFFEFFFIYLYTRYIFQWKNVPTTFFFLLFFFSQLKFHKQQLKANKGLKPPQTNTSLFWDLLSFGLIFFAAMIFVWSVFVLLLIEAKYRAIGSSSKTIPLEIEHMLLK